MAERRRTFAPVVLAGLAAAALAAVAGARDWVDLVATSGGDEATEAMTSQLTATAAQGSPLAAALALVVLACWGVVLVTRGWFRRAVAGLGALAGAGYAATTVAAPWTLRRDFEDEIARLTGGHVDMSVGLTAWWWTALVVAVLVVATTVAAVVLVRQWPEMGTRYDAPVDRPTDTTTATNLDLWKALDEGRDPTDGSTA